jgi:hypothetical protein
MSDQPETMLEYHILQLERTIMAAVMLLGSAVFAAVGGGVISRDPASALLLGFGAVWLATCALAIGSDGYARTALNTLFRTDLSELKRPDEGTTGGLADD